MHLRTFVILLSVALLVGCSSSHNASTAEQTPPAQTPAGQPAAQTPSGVKVDTVTADRQNTERPAYETPPAAPPTGAPAGPYSVQVGAYKLSSNADRIVALTKERFPNTVYMFQDKDSFYKVMVGDFATVEEGRKFRDEMAKQFPAEYKDAWVWHNPQK